MNTPEQFWARVRCHGKCWKWLGAKNNSGYGTLLWKGRTAIASRVAAFIAGLVTDVASPHDKRATGFVLHSCDNKACCRPSHLYVGTQSQNLHDAYLRGQKQQLRGTKHANAKLTPTQVRQIRELYAAGETQVALAARFSVSQRTVSLVVRRETYVDA